MYTAEIRDSAVQNLILIEASQREAYQAATGSLLADCPEELSVAIGDAYDEETRSFSRGGVPLTVLLALEIREKLLRQSDHTQLLDFPCSDEERAAWQTYRQALRDIPAQAGYPNEILWPAPPLHDGQGDTLQQVLDTMMGGDSDA